MGKEKVNVKLTKQEAIIFFDFLSRFNDSNKLNIEDHSEEIVLWSLCCQLESILVEPFRGEWKQVLLKARQEVKEKK